MLRLLGQSEYGLYQLVSSVVSYLSLLSLGFGASYMRFYAREKAHNNEDGVAKVNGMFLLIFCVLSLICLLCGIVLLANINLIFGAGLTETEYATAKVLMFLMIISLALTFPNSIFNSIITSQEKFFLFKKRCLIAGVIESFSSFAFINSRIRICRMVIVSTLLTVIVLLSNIYYCFEKTICAILL